MKYIRVVFCPKQIGIYWFWVIAKGYGSLKRNSGLQWTCITQEKKGVYKYIGLINWYKDMWSRRLHAIQTLGKLTQTNIKFKQTYIEQEVFDEIKWVVARYVLLVYPGFILFK